MHQKSITDGHPALRRIGEGQGPAGQIRLALLPGPAVLVRPG